MNTSLEITDLSIAFSGPRGTANIIDNATLSIPAGSIVGLVGESGSGKTVIAKALLDILPPMARLTAGEACLGELAIVARGRKAGAHIRGSKVAMIFQNPKSSLNPIRKIGRQIEDVILQHTKTTATDAKRIALEALAAVRLPDPRRIYHAYPFELSGGMAQRAVIAVALACRPALLIADEPTTGLDASLQREIMDLIKSISRERHMSVLLITHDLTVAEDYCDAIAVMHAGHIVEIAPTRTLLDNPKHPYTIALTKSMPSAIGNLADLHAINGVLPDLYGAVTSCRFLARCEHRTKACESEQPLTRETVGENHWVLCRRPQ